MIALFPFDESDRTMHVIRSFGEHDERPLSGIVEKLLGTSCVTVLDRHNLVVDPHTPLWILEAMNEAETCSMYVRLFYTTAVIPALALPPSSVDGDVATVTLENVHVLRTPEYQSLRRWLVDETMGRTTLTNEGVICRDGKDIVVVRTGSVRTVYDFVRRMEVRSSDSFNVTLCRDDAVDLMACCEGMVVVMKRAPPDETPRASRKRPERDEPRTIDRRTKRSRPRGDEDLLSRP